MKKPSGLQWPTLILASVGGYGVLSFLVAQQTHEIGVRRALGAQRRDVVKLVIMQGARPILIGGTMGTVAALGLTRLLGSML